jgi:DDE superfamily endonuclease
MNLFQTMDSLVQEWSDLFSQERMFDRVRRLVYGQMLSPPRHTTSAAICAVGHQFHDWSADYRAFSRSPWNPEPLFDAVIDRVLQLLPPYPAPVIAAMDDTACKKSGRRIPGVATVRDPQSPPYHVNLIRGLRFVQASLMVAPLDREGPARSLPVRFEPAPPVAKPKKNAPPQEWDEYKKRKKDLSLTKIGLNTVISLRDALDQRHALLRQFLIAVDGSYTNQVLLKALPARTTLIGRIRQDADLHLPLDTNVKTNGRPRKYGLKAPTPKEVLSNDSIPFQEIPCFAVGEIRNFKVKVFSPVFWSKAGHDKPLLLVVIKPVGYRLRKGSKLLYREPAFLICTDPSLDLKTLVQAYLYRWEIEVNHHDEKSIIGVAQAQTRNAQAVDRQPQLQVAAYSLLLLASILAHGFERTEDYLPLPKWRRKSPRPSAADLVNLLRQQILGHVFSADHEITFDHFKESPESNAKWQKLPLLTCRKIAGPEPCPPSQREQDSCRYSHPQTCHAETSASKHNVPAKEISP